MRSLESSLMPRAPTTACPAARKALPSTAPTRPAPTTPTPNRPGRDAILNLAYPRPSTARFDHCCGPAGPAHFARQLAPRLWKHPDAELSEAPAPASCRSRSEERRVGEEGRER